MTRRSTRWLAVLTVVLGAASGLRAEDAKVTGDLKKMQGAWVRDGDEGLESQWVIEGDTLKSTVNGQDYTATIRLDPKAAPHRSADITIKEGPAETLGKSSKAIYKFDGEKLVFCVSLPGADARPTEFKMVENEAFLFRLKKEK